MTTTPLPRKPTGKLAFAYQTIAALEQARADLESQLKQWGNVFGHLGTADECGNEWIKLQDENQRLREALRKIKNWPVRDGSVLDGPKEIASAALEKQPLKPS